MKYCNTITYNKKTPYVNIADNPVFFIAGRCYCGSRHYSEIFVILINK